MQAVSSITLRISELVEYNNVREHGGYVRVYVPGQHPVLARAARGGERRVRRAQPPAVGDRTLARRAQLLSGTRP